MKQSETRTHTYRENHSVLEVWEVLVALLTEELRPIAALGDFLVAVLAGAGLVQTAFLLGKGDVGLDVEVVRLLAVP